MAIAMEVRETEVVAKATRRRFTAEYKRGVLQEAERAKAPGEVGALLRREGLYSSHLASWRAARERGEVAGLAAKRPGPKPKPRDERDRRIAELERETARLRRHLERAEAVIEVLAKLVSVRGAPKYLRSDNGPEFVSRAVLRWLHRANIETAAIDPDKPWQNGSNESFNGKLRDECLSMQWFKNRIDASIVIEDWRREYNAVRPHLSLNNLTPAEFAKRTSTRSPEQAVF